MDNKDELPKAYDAKDVEDKIYKKWEESGFFAPEAHQPMADNLDKKEPSYYSILMPPPNVTGTLHLGHASMLAIEDILTRYNRMQGKKTLWLPGTDHAAIATQTKVEKILKEEGTNRHELGKEKFLERVREFAQNSHDTIKTQIEKMGSSCDWGREAYTLDDVRTKAVRSVFKLMYDDGLIYRGDRVVNWCPRCHSTLADDEVEYKEQKTKLYTFKYSKDFPFTIATTRPETKLGDTAVAVNPKDERYKDFIGKTYEVNFCGIDLKLKIIADRNVDMDFGTGALGVTPAHSMADWQMSQENDLEIIKVIDEDGNIKDGFSEFAGKTVKEARKMIVENLQKQGLMEKEEEVDNNLSVCYRCDTPIEPLPSLQWFIDVNKKIEKFEGKSIKDISIEAVKSGVFGRDKIKIYPERFEKNYFHWMENLKDWCISRQILFGHQIPVWYKNKSKVESQKSKVREEIYVGVEAPEGDGWTQDPDTLDTWFSSGLWTFSTLAKDPDEIKIENGKLVIDSEDFKNFHPTNVLETGYDILFFWIARMIIMTTYAVEDIPFQDVYLHGLVLDEKGKKMSKSKGNVIDPLEMIEKYGTDAVRLSLVIGSTPGNDIRLSEEKIAGFRNFANKLWNIARYIMMNYELRIMNHELNLEKVTLSDQWILYKISFLIKEVTEHLDKYEFSLAGEKLRVFMWDDLADWYLEICKIENGKDEILSYVLKTVLKLLHPFMPFVTEEIWGKITSPLERGQGGVLNQMLIVEKWPEVDSRFKIEDLKLDDFELIQKIIVGIRNARSENKIEPSKKIKAVVYVGEKLDLVKLQEHLIKNLRTGIEEIEIKESGKKIDNAIYTNVGGIDVYLIAEIDKEKEKQRINSEIEQLQKYIKQIEGKLSNEQFIKNAPENIVSAEKEKLETAQEKMEKLNDGLNNL